VRRLVRAHHEPHSHGDCVGLLAGVLARLGLQAFAAAQTALPLVLLMLLSYLLDAGAVVPRYAVV
jgi:benzoate membrane transport protein